MMEDYDFEDEDEVEYYAVRPNKTLQKKELAALFTMAEKMSELSKAQLSTLELPEKIHNAVTEVSGMAHTGARKRLLKFIDGQLHKIEIEPIAEKLARIENKSAHAVREHHIVENWRDHLLAEGNEALTELFEECPDADRQHIRQLVRNAQKESQAGKPPKSSRLLYQYLKGLFNFEELADEMPEIADDLDIDDEELDS
jgi:ribosome-associated protein